MEPRLCPGGGAIEMALAQVKSSSDTKFVLIFLNVSQQSQSFLKSRCLLVFVRTIEKYPRRSSMAL